MLPEVRVWLLIAGLTVITFVVRAAFILPGSRLSLPPTLDRVLRYAPAAALAAIIVPDLFRVDGAVVFAVDNPRVVAGAVAVVVAARTRNILLTIVCGMAALFVVGLLVS